MWRQRARAKGPAIGLAAGIAAAWLLLTGAAANPFQFKDEAGKFAASFPAEPMLDKRTGASATGPHVHYTWEVDIEDRHFSVTYTEYATPPAKNYDKNVMALLAATNGRLIRQARVDQDRVDGREVVTLTPDNAVMRQRLFQVGNRLYQVLYGGPYGTETRPDVELFMESFQLLN